MIKICFNNVTDNLMKLYEAAKDAVEKKGMEFPYNYSEFKWYLRTTPEEFKRWVSVCAAGIDENYELANAEKYEPRMRCEFGQIMLSLEHENDMVITADDEFFKRLSENRHAKDLEPAILAALIDLYEEAANDGDGRDWINYGGCPGYIDLIGAPDNLGTILEELDLVFRGSIAEILRTAGKNSLTLVAQRLHVPYRTLQDWVSGKSECKLYIRLYIAKTLGLI